MATAFEFYLRSGRALSPTEFKFNPWHDPEDGRFTFAGQGRHFAGGSRPGGPGIRDRSRAGKGSQVGGDDAAGSSGRTAARRRTDPNDPRNYTLYTVKRGDSLTKIARLRKGLTAADLAWLNELNADRPLQVGQSIKLPHQQFLDAGKRARDTFLALAAYMDATGGKLPPNVARPPSIAAQVEASGVRGVRKNVYDVDMLLRPRRAAGELRLQSRARSRSAQANAGKPDRRSTDDGGHYIAARFNGPREWFNHFAQDSNFNRGGYRALEDEWAKAVRAGRRVLVDITPYYRGTSRRPYKLTIVWIVDGHRRSRDFQNERGGR